MFLNTMIAWHINRIKFTSHFTTFETKIVWYYGCRLSCRSWYRFSVYGWRERYNIVKIQWLKETLHLQILSLCVVCALSLSKSVTFSLFHALSLSFNLILSLFQLFSISASLFQSLSVSFGAVFIPFSSVCGDTSSCRRPLVLNKCCRTAHSTLVHTQIVWQSKPIVSIGNCSENEKQICHCEWWRDSRGFIFSLVAISNGQL